MDNEFKPRESVRMSNSKAHFTETIYMKQKKRIQQIHEEQKNKEKTKLESSSPNEISKMIWFNDINLDENTNWEYSTFDVQNIYNEETPVRLTEWSESFIKPSIKGVEIRSLIFRTKEYFQLDTITTELSAYFSLKGESSFWIISRSDKDFDEFSAIIKIYKEDKSQNMHVAMGTFVKDIHNNLIFKIFSKQQLIDYSKVRNKSYKENDVCELKAFVYENGEEKITAKIYGKFFYEKLVNDSRTENIISSEFFLPFFNKKSTFMIAGSGQQICVKSFMIKYVSKMKTENIESSAIFSNDKRNCDCCLIY